MTGGRVREVRSNTTVPALEVNRAERRLIKSSVPFWYGFPQPEGGFPSPSESRWVARQKVPSILAHSIPQCVKSWYGLPSDPLVGCLLADVACAPQPAATTARPSAKRARARIR
jgi:hypothetical protein